MLVFHLTLRVHELQLLRELRIYDLSVNVLQSLVVLDRLVRNVTAI